MAKLNVNPNRMELTSLKRRLATATRGHKLLKDKQDELMRQFIDLVRRNNTLRKEVEAELQEAYKDFVLVGALTSPEFLEEAVMFPREQITLEITQKNIMSVNVPEMKFNRVFNDDESGIYPYGFYGTSDELDRALEKLFHILPRLLELGEVEKTCNLMADEIEKTRRRVNALEYMTIPQLEETIRYIQMKLDENDRSTTTRLMKFKSMAEKQTALEDAAAAQAV
ncbi:V-type ATP synthase subunit D [Ruminococcaceae bacterium OttesenSCG-928-L11]|nr:V-type ATP synthase subunit D [Ruminococcaceae bacterium OttesenSCG-928-L11]